LVFLFECYSYFKLSATIEEDHRKITAVFRNLVSDLFLQT